MGRVSLSLRGNPDLVLTAGPNNEIPKNLSFPICRLRDKRGNISVNKLRPPNVYVLPILMTILPETPFY